MSSIKYGGTKMSSLIKYAKIKRLSLILKNPYDKRLIMRKSTLIVKNHVDWYLFASALLSFGDLGVDGLMGIMLYTIKHRDQYRRLAWVLNGIQFFYFLLYKVRLYTWLDDKKRRNIHKRNSKKEKHLGIIVMLIK